ncbi:MAG TPA: amidase family protein [Candidatus Limnocylindria bacterium]|nr:amidase family protein [Candidatus Limnocylindria bacterium]
MRAPLRRPLALAVLLTLVLSISTIGTAVVIGRGPTSTTVAGIDVDATNIPDLQDLMDSHRLSSVQLTQFYLHRIKKLNPQLNAVITVSPTALADARDADRLRRQGDEGPLLGIPIIVKDNINTSGMPTTAGSWALAGSTPSDAFIVQQLKAAGAIVIGKANLSEWANFRSIPSSSGWSGIGGQTNLAHVLDRNPCGSSSGSGVVAAADLAVAAVGTETDGSIVCPSGANGIVGIKPTLGLLSRAGVVPISADQDTAGPMARNVTDAAVLLGALTGVDSDDPATSGQVAFTDYTQFLGDADDPESLEGARIGVWSEGTVFAEDPNDPRIAATQAVMDSAIAALAGEGATIVNGADIDIGPAGADELFALECEFKTDIATYLQTYVDGTNPVSAEPYAQTLAELIDFNEANQDIEGGPDNPALPWDNEIWDQAEATGGRGDPDCDAARAALTPAAQSAIDDLMAELDLDAIVAPTNGPAWVTNPMTGDDFTLFIGSSSPSAVAGYASITVPAGYVDDVLPIGLTFIGGQWDEPDLIGFAYDFEQATQVRVPPSFLPTIGD